MPPGTFPPDLSSPQPTSDHIRPGLAADPRSGRAFVVPPTGRIAEIELSSLAVSYRDLAASASRRRRVPSDGGGGPVVFGSSLFRQAAWIGDGLIAVSGSDDSSKPGETGPVQTSTPAGLQLIDTATWSTRTLDTSAVSFTRTAGLVVATESSPWRIAVYDATGRRIFRRAFTTDGFNVGDGYAYLTLGNEYRRHGVRVLDLRTGRLVRTSWVPGWFYPISGVSPQPCWC